MKKREVFQALQALGAVYSGMALGAIATNSLPALWSARSGFSVLFPLAGVVVAALVIDVWRWRPDDGSRTTFAVRVVASAAIVLTAIGLIAPPAGPCPTCPPKSLVRHQ